MDNFQVQQDKFRLSTALLCFAGSLALFWLGTFAGALKKAAESGGRTLAYYDKGTWSSMIVVYVTVCFPITWSAYSAYSQTNDLGFLAFNVVAIIVAGVELEFHAKKR